MGRGRWRSGAVRKVAGALTGLLLVACGDPFFTASITDRRPFDPPPVSTERWYLTEGCSGRSGDLARIEWFLASSIDADGRPAKARWTEPHQIVLVAGYETDERVVRHEMLHDLLNGDPGHESQVWDDCELRF